jgi:subtilisin family serine protease
MARSFKVYSQCSLSLSALLAAKPKIKRRTPRRLTRALAITQSQARPTEELVRILIEAPTKKELKETIGELREEEVAEALVPGIYSATLMTSTLRRLAKSEYQNMRFHTKKRSKPRLDKVVRDIGVFASAAGPRQVTQTGKNVLIGIVDSGFDLTHPMFLDANGKLRVEGLLVQSESGNANREFTASSLQAELDNGSNPALDENGHGTHVASIAGGTKFRGLEGIAPDARFLLVKTNFLDTDKAVKWVFTNAGNKPCVVNLSLGNHFGAHDGTDAEERLFETLAGAGKIIVASAGNERNDSLHIGGQFATAEVQTVTFDTFQPDDGSRPEAGMTLWFSKLDNFTFTLISPAGQEFSVPTTNSGRTHSASGATIQLIRGAYDISNLVQIQIQVRFGASQLALSMLPNWRLRCTCVNAVVGRLDGWFFNSGFGRFHPHPLVEAAKTVGLPATSQGCIAVASHVSKNNWDSDTGSHVDSQITVGTSSGFSSLGPTRDGKEKPEISAPGHFVTAALATNSELQDFDDRSLDSKRVLTIEGTSMASPVVAGVVALMLQKKNNLTPAKVRSILASSGRKDAQTGSATWTPAFGGGKIDVASALAQM